MFIEPEMNTCGQLLQERDLIARQKGLASTTANGFAINISSLRDDASCLRQSAVCLTASAYCFLPTAHCSLLTAY